MKINSKEVKEAIREHILECVYDYNEKQFDTFEEAKKHLKKEFDRVANYPNNIKRYPSEQTRFSDYLLGLPFYFEFENEKIEKFLNNLGINPENKKFAYTQVLTLYHYLIYKEVF